MPLKNSRKYVCAALISGALCWSTAAQSDILTVPTVSSGDLPKNGEKMGDIERKYGEPMSQNGPTGEPPIYFWEYPDFTVYFEYNVVIHAVNKHKRLQNK